MTTKDRKITLRLSEKLYEKLKRLSKDSDHSVTEEINLRLEGSLSNDETSIDSIFSKIDALLLVLKRSTSRSVQKKSNNDAELYNHIAELDSEKKQMLMKLVQSLK